MKRYIDASFVAFLAGWLMQVVVYSFYPLRFSNGTSSDNNLGSMAFAFFLFGFMANLLFVQLPSASVQKVFFNTNAIQFALLLSAYGVVIFALTMFWAASSNFSQSLPLFVSAAINGLTYGLVFHLLWKPESLSK